MTFFNMNCLEMTIEMILKLFKCFFFFFSVLVCSATVLNFRAVLSCFNVLLLMNLRLFKVIFLLNYVASYEYV
jgi:hypothetical protein